MNNFAAVSLFVAALGMGSASGSAGLSTPGSHDKLPEHSPEKLVETLTTFFQTDDPKERKKVVKAIEEAGSSNWQRVADALRKLNLWKQTAETSCDVEFSSSTGQTRSVRVALPMVYRPAQSYPLILRERSEPTHRKRHSHRPNVFDYARQEEPFAFVATTSAPLNQWFHKEDASADDLDAMLVAIRKRFHIDNDRVYILAVGEKNDSSWITALMHADRFAGALFLQTMPHVPYPNQLYPLLLSNLRNLHMNVGWEVETVEAEFPKPAPANTGSQTEELIARQRTLAKERAARSEVIAQHMLLIASQAQSMQLPFDAYARPLPLDPYAERMLRSNGDKRANRDNDLARSLFSIRRNLLERRVSHWFRYLAQGHNRWLRATGIAGDEWTSDQLSILPPAIGDHDEFITNVIKDKLSFIAGSIEGQHITIETRRCAGIELILYDGLIDWRKPVTVTINGVKRLEKNVAPSIATLLDTAYQTWDLGHPVGNVLRFQIDSSSKR